MPSQFFCSLNCPTAKILVDIEMSIWYDHQRSTPEISADVVLTTRGEDMRRISFVVAVLAILMIVSVVKTETQSESTANQGLPLKILFPKDKTYVTQETIKIIGTVSDVSIQQVNVLVTGGEPVGGGSVPIVKNAFEAAVRLQPGLSEISILSAGNEEAASKITIFRKTDQNASEVPANFKQYFLHTPIDQKVDCQSCHKLDSTPVDYRRMNVMESTCQTDECHGEIGDDKYVHGPVGSGTCIACHNPHGSVEEYSVSRSGLLLCLVCHEDKENELKQEYVHGIITSSGCIDCHDPHESANKFQLLGDTTSELCFTCHDDTKMKLQFVHGPVGDGDCNLCHNAHASPNDMLLAEAGDELCFLCHDVIKEETTRQNIHSPVEDACANCHDAHGSPNDKLLNKAASTLCFDCHSEIQDVIQAATVHHKPVADGDCMGCHTAHGSDYTKLLQAPAQQICFSCHTELGKAVAESQYRHGPVDENDCYACHRTHGSANPKILNKYFPPQFYNSYSTENYAICFECHEQDIALDKVTTTLTDFRNGSRNLHNLHINKEQKGRSCKACHEVHASNQSRHIRTEVPYGKMWSYPISFSKTETGGTCIVGCHKPKNYDRVNAVAYDE